MNEGIRGRGTAGELVVAYAFCGLDGRLQMHERCVGSLGEAEELAELEQDTRLELLVTSRFFERLAPQRDSLDHSARLGSKSCEPEQDSRAGRARGRFVARLPNNGQGSLEVARLEVKVGGLQSPTPAAGVISGRRERDGLLSELGRSAWRPAGASMPRRGVERLGDPCARSRGRECQVARVFLGISREGSEPLVERPLPFADRPRGDGRRKQRA